MAATLAPFAGTTSTTKPGNHVIGDLRICRAVLTGDTAYPTGGYTMSTLASSLGLAHIMGCFGSPVSRTGDRLGGYITSTGKFAIYTALGTEAAGSSDQSTAGIFDLFVIGV